MAGNSFGKIFKLTTFGESHGIAVGGVIDGCPPEIFVDEEFIAQEINRRKPGNYKNSTARKEDDKVEFISGLFEGKTTGAPIAFIIKNTDHKSSDYDELKDVFRPSHADYTYLEKYGIRDYRGGGRASARETVSRVVAGAIAKLILRKYGIDIFAYTSQLGNIEISDNIKDINPSAIENDILFCPDKKASVLMQQLLDKLKQEGDSTGCVINCVVKCCPAGLGEPVFDKLQADLAKAMLSIPAAKGFEYGEGFKSSSMKGSEHNDIFKSENNKIILESNHSGGIQGGISNGEDIYFKIAFKPISSINKMQKTVDINGNNIEISIKGRHDVCVVPRVIPVVEAMTALVILDHLLLNITIK
ncbi:MAG: chorismate synthase [Bacteroidetes bacterium]|nr:chorismate synthase [Bacteroidota bacterium]